MLLESNEIQIELPLDISEISLPKPKDQDLEPDFYEEFIEYYYEKRKFFSIRLCIISLIEHF